MPPYPPLPSQPPSDPFAAAASTQLPPPSSYTYFVDPLAPSTSQPAVFDFDSLLTNDGYPSLTESELNNLEFPENYQLYSDNTDNSLSHPNLNQSGNYQPYAANENTSLSSSIENSQPYDAANTSIILSHKNDANHDDAGNTTAAMSEYWRTMIPLGIKFRPADEELLTYLEEQSKDNLLFSQGIITSVDVYGYEPHQLPSMAIDFGDGKMYFFTRVKKIGAKKTERIIRTRPECYWKGNQSAKDVIATSSKEIVGSKTSLTYFQGKNKTQWLMNEYKLPPNKSADPKEYELVLAVIYYYDKRRRDED